MGCQLVQMDLELKDEFKGRTIRGKCWPMPEKDADEIEKQVEELSRSRRSVSKRKIPNTLHAHIFRRQKKSPKQEEW